MKRLTAPQARLNQIAEIIETAFTQDRDLRTADLDRIYDLARGTEKENL